jgi:hypothetical protein
MAQFFELVRRGGGAARAHYTTRSAAIAQRAGELSLQKNQRTGDQGEQGRDHREQAVLPALLAQEFFHLAVSREVRLARQRLVHQPGQLGK